MQFRPSSAPHFFHFIKNSIPSPTPRTAGRESTTYFLSYFFPVKALITRNNRVFFLLLCHPFLSAIVPFFCFFLERQEENPTSSSIIIIRLLFSLHISYQEDLFCGFCPNEACAFLSWSLSWFLFI